MDGFEFEQHCANVLAHKGYKKVEVTKGSGDQGIDIIAYKGGEKYGIQCKYYLNPVGNKAVQEAYTGISVHQCDVAMVMTNNTFTKGAREAAESTGVILWDYVPRQVEPYFFGLFKRVLLCSFLLLVGCIIYYIF
ncbi:MAG: restriction endonuclease [Lachnospiraceae bacterium]|nr:restriction endonuclease [Lachnospiraceae bacterium]